MNHSCSFVLLHVAPPRPFPSTEEWETPPPPHHHHPDLRTGITFPLGGPDAGNQPPQARRWWDEDHLQGRLKKERQRPPQPCPPPHEVTPPGRLKVRLCDAFICQPVRRSPALTRLSAAARRRWGGVATAEPRPQPLHPSCRNHNSVTIATASLTSYTSCSGCYMKLIGANFLSRFVGCSKTSLFKSCCVTTMSIGFSSSWTGPDRQRPAAAKRELKMLREALPCPLPLLSVRMTAAITAASAPRRQRDGTPPGPRCAAAVGKWTQ